MAKVTYEKSGGIAWVTINRPEARNAIDPEVHRLMIAPLPTCIRDESGGNAHRRRGSPEPPDTSRTEVRPPRSSASD